MTTPYGGHLGWTAGENGAFKEPWVDAGVIEFLQASIRLVGVRETGFGGARPQVEEVEEVEQRYSRAARAAGV